MQWELSRALLTLTDPGREVGEYVIASRSASKTPRHIIVVYGVIALSFNPVQQGLEELEHMAVRHTPITRKRNVVAFSTKVMLPHLGDSVRTKKLFLFKVSHMSTAAICAC